MSEEDVSRGSYGKRGWYDGEGLITRKPDLMYVRVVILQLYALTWCHGPSSDLV